MATIVNGMRLARYFGTSAEFWMGLQADYDLKTSARTLKTTLNQIGRAHV